jgi:hypothetical protein
MKKPHFSHEEAFVKARIFFSLIAALFAVGLMIGCDVADPKTDPVVVFMGTAYAGQSIPFGTEYGYSEGSYSTSVLFSDGNSYIWEQTEGEDTMPPMEIPCEYDETTGEFSNHMASTWDGTTFGQISHFPVSFCTNDLSKLYLFTISQSDIEPELGLVFPRTIAEKTAGSEGSLEGTYHSNFDGENWVTTPDGTASMEYEGVVDYVYGAGTFSGTYVLRSIMTSDIEIPDYGIEIGTSDTTETIEFSGTWEYNEADNTITETITSHDGDPQTYTPYWVSYNDNLYLVTSQTRFYQRVLVDE